MSLLSSGSPVGQIVSQMPWLIAVVISIFGFMYLISGVLAAFGMNKYLAESFGLIAFAILAISGVFAFVEQLENPNAGAMPRMFLEHLLISFSTIALGYISIVIKNKFGVSKSNDRPKKSLSSPALILVAIAGSLFLVLQTKTVKNQLVNPANTNHPVQQAVKQRQAAINLPPDELNRRKEAYWRAYNQKEDDCRYPSTGNQIFECQRREENRRRGFEVRWKQQIQSGWVPPSTL